MKEYSVKIHRCGLSGNTKQYSDFVPERVRQAVYRAISFGLVDMFVRTIYHDRTTGDMYLIEVW